jgi:hypothetical protein
MSHAPEQLTMWSVEAPSKTEGPVGALALAAGSRLVSPLRAAVEKAQAAARPLVAPVADGDAYMPLLDYIAEQIETLEHIGDATHQVHLALTAAIHGRDGYDTWSDADLEEHIRRIGALRDALDNLRAAVVTLHDAERAAFSDFANVEMTHAHPNNPASPERSPGSRPAGAV